MMSEVTNGQEQSFYEDPLSYLPCSAITKFRKGQVIYDESLPSQNLYLVIEGCVKVSRKSGNSEIVMKLCQPDDFFGEATFVQASGERALALEPTKVMSWPAEVIQDIIQRHPKLGIALIQSLANRSLELGERIATLAVDLTSRRLAKTLVQLSEKLGQAEDAGAPDARRLTPFSHKTLAQYIGTTREAVTRRMNQFRRQGLVSYSRRDMIVYNDAFKQWLDSQSSQTEDQDFTPEPESPRTDTLSA